MCIRHGLGINSVPRLRPPRLRPERFARLWERFYSFVRYMAAGLLRCPTSPVRYEYRLDTCRSACPPFGYEPQSFETTEKLLPNIETVTELGTIKKVQRQRVEPQSVALWQIELS